MFVLAQWLLPRPARLERLWINDSNPKRIYTWSHHLLTFGEQIAGIWSTNRHCADAQSIKCHLYGLFSIRVWNWNWKLTQTLNTTHASLLSSRCWPWLVCSSWLTSRDLGRARSSYLARAVTVVKVINGWKTLIGQIEIPRSSTYVL